MADEAGAEGTLVFSVRAKRGEKVAAVRGLLTKLVVGASDGASPLFARRIAIDGRDASPFEFRLPIPAGEYGKLTVGLAELTLTTVDQKDQPVPLAVGESTFAVDLSVSAGVATRLVLDLDLDALPVAKAPGDVLALRLDDDVPAQTFKAPPVGETATFRLGLAAVALEARSLPPGAAVSLRAPGGDDLPPLFRRQVRVGTPLHVHAAAKLAAPAEVTVPFDAADLAAAGRRADEAVVLQLDEARTVYRELRPVRIDREASTLTVRVRSFSTFCACCPGIEIRSPELAADGFGRVVGLVDGETVGLVGRVLDPEGEVALLDPAPSDPAAPSLLHGGWFAFEGIPLPQVETRVALEARAPDLLPHVCEFVLRRAIVPRRITDPHRTFGAALALTESGAPHVTTSVKFKRFSDDDLVEPLAAWQRSFERLGPFLFRPTAERDGWVFRHLLHPTHFENETAALAIRLLAPFVAVPIDAAAPEPVRALRSLASFVGGMPPDDLRRPSVDRALELARPLLGPENLSLSPRAPLVALDGERIGAAFVAATLDSTDQALQSTLGGFIQNLYAALTDERDARPRARAGRLFFALGSFDEIGREIVADGIWCPGLALAIDPIDGQPTIAAIGVAPDVEVIRPDGVHVREPRSRLLLFHRQDDGGWSEELVLDDRPVVDVDLAFGPDGVPRLVAAIAATAHLGQKTHLISLRRAASGWTAQPVAIEVEVEGRRIRTDRGIWPRLAVDARGRSVLVFAQWGAEWRWHVAVEAAAGEDGASGGFRARTLRTARWVDLQGSRLAPEGDRRLQESLPVTLSGLSVAHWAPSIALDGAGRLWCAYPNGMLQLARIDLATLEIEDEPVAVDRSVGFFPALALRRGGAPAVVFKDTASPDGGDGDLFYLAVDDGAVVPGAVDGGSARFGRPLPPFRVSDLPTGGFAPHVPLDCDRIKNLNELPALLGSVLRDRRFHFEIYPDGGLGLPPYLPSLESHPFLFHLIRRLPSLPTLAVLTIDNRDFPDEGIDKIVITSFPEPVLRIGASLAEGLGGGLDQGVVPVAMRGILLNQGIALHQGFTTVTVVEPGNAWDVFDERAAGAGLRFISQRYHFRRGVEPGTGLSVIEIRLPAVLSVVARGEVPRDDLGRPAPCDTEQEDWDLLAGPFVQRFGGAPIALPSGSPGRIVFLSLKDIRLAGFEPHDPEGSAQQGGVRFTMEIPRLAGRNEDPGAFLFSVEPSSFSVTLAPSVVRGKVRWWVREVEARAGRVEADVDYGGFRALFWILAVIPGIGFLLPLADPIVDAVATSEVNDGLRGQAPGGFLGLFLEALQSWSDEALADHPAIESVYLRDGVLHLWSRSVRPLVPALEVLPAPGLSFGTVRLGEPPVRRNLLLTSVGGAPSVIEAVRIVSGAPEMRIDGAFLAPLVLEPGAAVAVPLEFEPGAPAGFRSGEIEVIADGGRRSAVRLDGIAAAALEPRLRLRPDLQLSFGAVSIGIRREETVEIANDGQEPLLLGPPRIEGEPTEAAAFSLVAPPTRVEPGQTSILRVAFQPQPGGTAAHRATLGISSNDPLRPLIELPLVAFAVSPGSVYVESRSLAFNDTLIEALQPPLPPGLPPTIHRGSTRRLRVVNLGAGTLTLFGTTFQALMGLGGASPHFHLWLADGTVATPVSRTIAAGQAFELVVQFLPVAVGTHRATVTIRSGDPAEPEIPIALIGVGVQ